MSAMGRLVSALLRQRSPALSLAAWAVALIGPTSLAAATHSFRASLGLAGFLFCALVIVVVVALMGGVRPALAAVAVGLVAGAFVFASPYYSLRVYLRLNNAPLIAFAVVGAAVAALINELTRLLEEQTTQRRVETALRRVATLVALAAPPQELFAAATEEVGQLLAVDHVAMGRFEPDGNLTIVAFWSGNGSSIPTGTQWQLGEGNLTNMVAQTGRPARLDRPVQGTGQLSAILRDTGIRFAVAAPIKVQARLWGIMAAGSLLEPFPEGAEAQLADFTELLATAISNAQSRDELEASRDELAASRARIVSAADDTRRRIERDLHDGAQQRLVSIVLALRAIQTTVPPQLNDLKSDLSGVAENLTEVQHELREFARGIHPAILAEGGIGPALKLLARRAPIPVKLDVRVQSRMPEPVEVAIYYIVSETLTNTAKHAHATTAEISVEAIDGHIHVGVQDDGAGGADPTHGSGLVGLSDRVQAIGGAITVERPAGAGTRIQADIPINR